MQQRFNARGARLLGLLAVVFGAVVPAVALSQQALELTLEEALRIALRNNLDIRIVAFQTSLAEEQVTSAKGTFEPSLFVGLPGVSSINPFPGGASFGAGSGFGGLGFSDVRTPSSTLFDVEDTTVSKSFAGLLDLQQTLPFGLRYDVSYNLGRNETNSIFQSLNPSWNNTLAVSVVQPLLRGRGKAAAAAQLLLAQVNTEVADAAFRAQVEQILLGVEGAYWDVVFAERDLQVKDSALQLAREQLDRTQAQVDVGLIAPVQVTQAEVQVAARETDLIVARHALENAHDALRAALRADQLVDGWDTVIRPVDEPDSVLGDISLQQAVAVALDRRAEVGQGQKTIEARQVEVDAARNALQPRVDLIGQLSANGIGGDLIIRDGLIGPVIGVEEGGYGDALQQMFTFDYVSWRFGLNVTVPLGNSAAEGNYAQATINEDRARAELQRTEQQILLEVRQAERGVRASRDAVASTRKTRELAERQLQIETDRFEVGMTTNFEVLRFQDDLAGARSDELRARIALRRAEASLLRSMGTLLEYHGIDIQ